MDKIFFHLALFILSSSFIYSQSVPVTGRVVNGANPLPGCSVAVFTSNNGSNPLIDRGISDGLGRFSILSSITDVKQENNSTAIGYSLSVNYPNPGFGHY